MSKQEQATQEQATPAKATYTYGPVSGRTGYSYVYLGAGEGKVLLGMAQRTGTTGYVAHLPVAEGAEPSTQEVPNGGRAAVAEVLYAVYAAAQAPKGKRAKAKATPAPVEPKQEQAPAAPQRARKAAQAAPAPVQEQAAPLTGPGNMRPKAAVALHAAIAVLREHWGTPLSCREVEERLGYPGKTVAGLLLRASRTEGYAYGVQGPVVGYYPHTNTGGREYKGSFVYVGTPEEREARKAEERKARAAKRAQAPATPARARKQGK